MRCDNCGWTNPEGVERCQKCNQKLRFGEYEEPQPVRAITEPTADTSVVNCNKCGREYASDMASCPNCGFANTSSSANLSADKSMLKKTMAFSGETPIVPTFDTMSEPPLSGTSQHEVLPFGIKDKNDLKKTIAVKDFQAAEANQAPAFPDIQSLSKEDLKKTVVAFKNEPEEQPAPQNAGMQNIDKANLKSTIVDLQNSELMQRTNTEATKNKLSRTNEDLNCYTLESMDHEGCKPIVLKILATAEINLRQNDIILIGGVRYRTV